MYEDKTLTCRDCGNEFVFTAGEQQFYADHDFKNEPKCCKACRNAKKQANRASKEIYTAVCADCGGEAKLRFQPSNDKPVYCSECFDKRRNS